MGQVTGSAGDYAVRFYGDVSGNANFQSLMGQTTVNGLAANYHFDGVYTDVTAVPAPEPESLAMLLAGLGLVGCTLRRRKGKLRV